ncbi:hypothetical protein NDU88_008310 [Pleurodeles waltl]|uniref:Uncharacterized protein n=1 Tax=Pleurodeles waltl TaxID=8319 RepID=A0AAV7RSS8_PLEWA|nr:hypothetical protein NDU88_008310 [Pleurodeles waltl]
MTRAERIPDQCRETARNRIVAPSTEQSGNRRRNLERPLRRALNSSHHPEETWTWVEARSTSLLSADPQHGARRRHPKSGTRRTTYRSDPPTAEKTQKERRQAMEAAAMTGGGAGRSEASSPQSTQREDEHLGSDNETMTSSRSSVLLPMVTPGTADEII